MPRASTTCASEGAGALPTPMMTPSATCTSTSRGPSGVWTMPPSMTSAFVRLDSVKLEIGDAEQRRIRNAGPADVLLAALSAVEDDHEIDDLDPRVAKHLCRAQGVATGGDDVLDHCDPLSRLEPSLYLLRCPVSLGFFAHEDQGQAGLHGDGSPQQHRAQLRRREALRLRRHQVGEMAAQPAQQRRIGFEQELVEVAVRASSRAKDEIALEVRGGDQLAPQRFALSYHMVNLMDRNKPPGARLQTLRAAAPLRRNAVARAGSGSGTGSPTVD